MPGTKLFSKRVCNKCYDVRRVLPTATLPWNDSLPFGQLVKADLEAEGKDIEVEEKRSGSFVTRIGGLLSVSSIHSVCTRDE